MKAEEVERLNVDDALKMLIAYRGWMTGKRSDKHDWCPVEVPDMARALGVAIDHLRALTATPIDSTEIERLEHMLATMLRLPAEFGMLDCHIMGHALDAIRAAPKSTPIDSAAMAGPIPHLPAV